MKTFFVVISFFAASLIFGSMPSLSKPGPSPSQKVGAEEKTAVQTLLSQYLRAFQEGNTDHLKQVSTEDFFKSLGEPKTLQKNLEGIKKRYQGSSLVDLEIHKLKSNQLVAAFKVSFLTTAETKTTPIPEQVGWFEIQKIAGAWKITKKMHDYAPGQR